MDTDTKLANSVSAQKPIYDQVRRELGAGRKESHSIGSGAFKVLLVLQFQAWSL